MDWRTFESLLFGLYLWCPTRIQLSFTLILLQMKSENEKKHVDQKVKQSKAVHASHHAAPHGELLSPSPPLPSSWNSSPNSSSGAAPIDQKKFAEAALKMIAEDMLPLRLECCRNTFVLGVLMDIYLCMSLLHFAMVSFLFPTVLLKEQASGHS